jgi:hypothetical protein
VVEDCLINTSTPQVGIQVTFNNANLYDYYANINLSHINQSLWAYSGSPCAEWVEAGVTWGFIGTAGCFYYNGEQNNTGNFEAWNNGGAPENGSSHTWDVYYLGSGYFEIERDGVVINTDGGLGYGACESITGLEISAMVGAEASSGTFNVSPMWWLDTNGTWHEGWTPYATFNSYPCGAGYSPPNCFNGALYSTNYWADNYPG